MKTQLVITDLTRMYRGKVCIAGYDKTRKCIRPVLPPPGIPESSLYQDGKAVIYPFSLVEIDLLKALSEPPHTEDCQYDPDTVRFVRPVQGREEVLGWSLFASVGRIFEQPIRTGPGYYVMDCRGPRSLGTTKPVSVQQVIYAKDEEEAWDYRLEFADESGGEYRLKIVDLTWHYYCDSLRGEDRDPARIAAVLTEVLQARQIYLRIGLARGWKKFPDRCYLQITGVFTFPDYLDGKTFADFAPRIRQ